MQNLFKKNEFKKSNIQSVIANETDKTKSNLTKVFNFIYYGNHTSMTIGLISHCLKYNEKTAKRIVSRLKEYGFIQITQSRTKSKAFTSNWTISPIPVEEFITNAKGHNFTRKGKITNTSNETPTPIVKEVVIEQKRTIDEMYRLVENRLMSYNTELKKQYNQVITLKNKSLTEVECNLRGYQSTVKQHKVNIHQLINKNIEEMNKKIIKNIFSVQDDLLLIFNSNLNDFDTILKSLINDASDVFEPLIYNNLNRYVNITPTDIIVERTTVITQNKNKYDLEIEQQPND